uniref:Gag-Pol polyprotein n=1 Tax=Tanacetum cinerariifolium TaxID=118510 RepID=A0A6L2KA00_TANCI|nr:Gag-Pol polyprotein [Tanacetum cinerariifolium]
MAEITHQETPEDDDRPTVPGFTENETYANIDPENRKLIDAEAEAVHMILNGYGNDIYSTVDACPNAKEMWIEIKRLQQGESINIQDVKTKLLWKFGKFTSMDGESIESYYTMFYMIMITKVRNKLKVDNMQVNVQFLQQLQPEWSRFVTIVKQANNLDNVSYHTLFHIMKQH